MVIVVGGSNALTCARRKIPAANLSHFSLFTLAFCLRAVSGGRRPQLEILPSITELARQALVSWSIGYDAEKCFVDYAPCEASIGWRHGVLMPSKWESFRQDLPCQNPDQKRPAHVLYSINSTIRNMRKILIFLCGAGYLFATGKEWPIKRTLFFFFFF